MEIASDKNQLTILFVEESSRAKQTLAYCQTAGIPIREINLSKTKITGTMITEIADKLGILVKDLVNPDHPIFMEFYKDADLEDNDIIKIIHKHPDLLKQPIVIKGDKIELVETPTDVLKLTL